MKMLTNAKYRAISSAIGGFFITTGAGLPAVLSLFLIPVTSEYGFSQASFAVHATLFSLLGVISHPIIGKLLTRHGERVRLFAAAGALGSLLLFSLMSQCKELYQFYIVSSFMSFLLPIVGSLLGLTVVTSWFDKRRSLAIAIVMMGSSGGTVIYAQIARYFIDAFGWRMGYFATGVTLSFFVLIGTVLISPPPETLGMKAYGWGKTPSQKPIIHTGLSQKEALKTPCFWFCALATLIGTTYVMGVSQTLAPMFQRDYGFSLELSAALISLNSLTSAVSKPFIGMLYERIGSRITIIATSILAFISLAILTASSSPTFAIPALILFGLGNMFCTVILSSFVAECFGKLEYSAIKGNIDVAFTIGTSLGPIMAGKMFDTFSSYRPTFAAFTCMSVITLVIVLIAQKKAPLK